MASAAAPRHGRAPDLPVRPVIATPSADSDGPVSVASLLRREGRRAAHALDRPLVPRARDLGNADGRTTHGAAVAAGALLAVTAVLGSNALGDPALLSGIGVDDAADSGPVAVPNPAPESVRPPTPATGVLVGQAVAALQEAGGPVQAVLTGGLPGSEPVSDAVSGAGIVAATLASPAPEGAAAAASDDDTRDSDDASDSDSSSSDGSDRDGDAGREDDGDSDERGSSEPDDQDDASASDDSDEESDDESDDESDEADGDPDDADRGPSAADGGSSGSDSTADDDADVGADGSVNEGPDAGSPAESDSANTGDAEASTDTA